MLSKKKGEETVTDRDEKLKLVSKWPSVITRSDLRKQSLLSHSNTRSSLQTCDLDVNHARILSLLEESHRKRAFRRANKLQGLLEVLEHLEMQNNDGQEIGYMRFDVAFELFAGHQEGPVEETTFRDALLHPQHGLCVNVVESPVSKCCSRYIVLKARDFDCLGFLKSIRDDQSVENELDVSSYCYSLENEVRSILNSMDTEWDRICAQVVMSANKSRKSMKMLGFDPDVIIKSVGRLKTVVQEVENSFEAAQDMVLLRNRAKQEKIQKEISDIDNLLWTRRNDWSEMRLNELEEMKAVKTEMLESVKEILAPTNAEAERKVNQAVKRQAVQLQEENRSKRLWLGAGAPRKLDSDDEEFVAKVIEEKATYHGRRHETVMYTNRRVKKRDVLSIANYRLLQRGKKMIRSATTVWNRSRPRNIRSHQAQNHIGKALFCTKKPPKAEDSFTETTHHQRAYVRNVQHFFFCQRSETEREYCFARSCDDKAYLRQGTSEGFEKT